MSNSIIISIFSVISIVTMPPRMPSVPGGQGLSSSDTVAIATGVLTLLGTIFTGIMAYLMAKLNKRAEAAAVQVREVKDNLADTVVVATMKLAEIATVGEATHTLVNANMGAQLKISSVALHRLAELTKHKEDVVAAELADKLFKEHQEKQAVVDAGVATKT